MIIEQRVEGDPVQRHRIGRDHKINLLAVQGRQGFKGKAGPDIDINLGPGAAEQFQHRKQPVETGMAFDGDVQPPGLAGFQRRKFILQRVDFRQDAFGKLQHPQAGG